MKELPAKKKHFTTAIVFLSVVFASSTLQALEGASTKSHNETLHVGVVGDTGIGERAFHRGFIAVAKALVSIILFM